MGTTAVENGTQLAVTKVVEVLAPSGIFELKRIKIVEDAQRAVSKAREITSITNDEQEQQATDAGRVLQVAKKELETIYTDVKRQIDAVKKPILEREKQDIGPVDAEKNRLGVEMTKYAGERRRKREEEERVAREVAQKQAEEDAIQRALDLAAAGESEAADAVLDEQVIAAPVVIQASAPKPTGSVARKNYDIEVTDLKALNAAVAAGQVPQMAILANEVFIRGLAKTMKEAFSMPGVKLVVTESTSFRA
jgi:hypothetical protein